MKKSSMIALTVIVLAAVVGGGYALFHKSNKTTSSSSSSSSTAVLETKTGASLGQYFATSSGQALYTYGGDTSGASNCTGSCLATWPAYQDKGSTTNLPSGVSTIKRTDNGETQYTYNGMPLYTFISDSNGQVTGNGVANFSVAKPMGSSSSTQSTTPATTPSNTSTNYSTDNSSSSSSNW